MSSLRHMTIPGAFTLLAMLVLRLPAGEAEWLLASLLAMRLRAARTASRIVHPHGF